MYNIQNLYQEAIRYAGNKHLENNQTVKGTRLPYVVHLSNVAMEMFMASFHTEDLDLEFAVQVALLHDTIEDTSATYEDVSEKFGLEIADAVLALSKDETLPKEEQIPDSLKRIRKMRKDVWAVKLADRITNLQPPPSYWDNETRIKYLEQSKLILREMEEGNSYLAERLKEKITEYAKYLH